MSKQLIITVWYKTNEKDNYTRYILLGDILGDLRRERKREKEREREREIETIDNYGMI